MRKKTIDLALAFVGALQRDTNDQATMWRELHPIAKAAGLEREEMAAAAAATAIDQGWMLIEDGHSVMLTDEGRRLSMAKPACEAG